MANPAYAPGAFFKHKVSTPDVLLKKAKQKAEAQEWSRCCKAVDARDKRVCRVTGASLTAGAPDPWARLERHHLEPRSLSKSRRNNARNVLTVSAGIHQLIHAGVLALLDKAGRPVKSVDAIDHVAWDRTRIARGEEPVRLRRGLAVVELEKVAK